jgi:hypothetical protein
MAAQSDQPRIVPSAQSIRPVSRVAKWKTAVQLVALGVLIAGPAGERVLPGNGLGTADPLADPGEVDELHGVALISRRRSRGGCRSVAFLKGRGEEYAYAFETEGVVRAAVDRVHAKPETREGPEVAKATVEPGFAREVPPQPPVIGGKNATSAAEAGPLSRTPVRRSPSPPPGPPVEAARAARSAPRERGPASAAGHRREERDLSRARERRLRLGVDPVGRCPRRRRPGPRQAGDAARGRG